MSCIISENINKGKHSDVVRSIGARNVVSVSTITTKFKSFKTSIIVPTETKAILKKITPGVHNILSYALSGTSVEPLILNKVIYNALLTKTDVVEEELVQSRLADVELIRRSERFFTGKKKLISPEQSNVNRVVYHSLKTDVPFKAKNRAYVSLTTSDIQSIKVRVTKELLAAGKAVTPEAIQTETDASIGHIITSALYRGYDLDISGFIDTVVVRKAVRNFNKFANEHKNRVVHAASSRKLAVGVTRYNNINSVFSALDTQAKKQRKLEINSDLSILNAFLSKRERKVLSRFNRASRASRVFVAGRVAGVFKSFIKDLEVDLLSQSQINEEYGPTFANKKGFNIGNSIVINVDQFDSSTLFHEFGHFYMKWLKQYKPESHSKLLGHVKSKHKNLFDQYAELYKGAGLTFSEQEIYEEIFVDELGMKAAKELMKQLPIDAILDNRYTKENEILPTGESVPVDLSGLEGVVLDTAVDEVVKEDVATSTEAVLVSYKDKEYTVNPDNTIISKTSGKTMAWKENNGNRVAILAKTAVKRGEAMRLEYMQKEYIVFRDDTILSLTSNKVMKWDKSNGNRKAILDLAGFNTAKTNSDAAKVVHKKWNDIKGNSIYREDGVYTMRPSDKDIKEHFGNPWTGSGIKGVIPVGPYAHLGYSELHRDKVKTLANNKVATANYAKWLLGADFADVEPKRREWIINQILSGKLDGKNLLYMQKAFEYYSHADALADIIGSIKEKNEPAGKSVEYKFTYNGVTIPTDYKLGAQQAAALRGAIDHVTGKGEKDISYTIQGYAGTGKTTVIGLLNKYINASSRLKRDFFYLTPTHAANAQLAKANLNNGVKKYPFTVASSTKSIIEEKTGISTTSLTKKLTSDRSNPVYIIDEASMLDEETIHDLKTAVKRANGTIVFMGDSAQIPMKLEGASRYVLSSVFTTTNKAELTEVFRTGANTLLKVLTKIRNNKELVIYKDEKSDSSLQFLDSEAYYDSMVTDFANDHQNTLHVAFRNKSVQKFNRNIKEDIAQYQRVVHNRIISATELVVGDKIVGYIGAQSKTAEKNSLANSIPYTVTRMAVKDIPVDFMSSAEPGTGILIEAKSNLLDQISKGGITGIKETTKTWYIPLSDTDSIQMDSFSRDVYDKNQAYLNGEIGEAFRLMHKANLKKEWSRYYSKQEQIKEFFLGRDLGGDYVYNINTQVFEPLNIVTHKRLYGAKMKDYVVMKGVDYGYSVTLHKSQGMTVDNIYIDSNDIKEAQRGQDTNIVDAGGNVINSFKNSLYYVGMSRASKKVVINDTNTTFDKIIDTSNQESLNTNDNALLTADIGKTVDAFTESFIQSLLGDAVLSPAEVGFNTDSSVADMFNFAADAETNTLLLQDLDSNALNNFKNFFIERMTPGQAFNGLMGRGLIRSIGGDRIVLLDEVGNRLDKDGNFSERASFKYYSDPIDAKQRKVNEDTTDEVEGFLIKKQNLAEVMFSVAKPESVVDIINNQSLNVKLNAEETHYVDEKGEYERTTTIIQEQFSSPFDEDLYIRNKIWTDEYKKYTEGRDSEEVKDPELHAKAQKAADTLSAKITVDSPEYVAIKHVFEFKTAHGTFFHNTEELFVRALNFSGKIKYKQRDGEKKKPYTWYMNHLVAAMSSGEVHKVEEHFQKYYFSYMEDMKGSKDYKDFLAVYDFFIKEFTVENAVGVGQLLALTAAAFEKHIFGVLKGPLTFMPEVKLSSASLGVAGKLDLIVIDGDGVAHIFDYKTKEVGKQQWWNLGGDKVTRLLSTLAHEPANAMMKASIQTSIYKLILLEMGIEVGPANIFYIESSIIHFDSNKGGPASAFADETKMTYLPKKVVLKPLKDVTSQVAEHFAKAGKESPVYKKSLIGGELDEAITIFSGGQPLDKAADTKQAAIRIWDAAMERAKGDSDNASYRKVLGGLESSSNNLQVIIKGHRLPLPKKIKGKEAQIEFIQDLLESKYGLRRMSSLLVDIFLDKEVIGKGGNSRRTEMIRLLGNATPETHDLVPIASNISYGYDHEGIFLLKNRVSGNVRMILLTPDYQNPIPFVEGNYNIFGNYVSNRAAKGIMPTLNWGNSNHNMMQIKGALAMIQARNLDPSFRVSSITANTGLEGNKLPRLVDLDTALKATKKMLELAKKAGDPIPESIMDFLKNDDLFEVSTYVPNPLVYIADYLDNILDPNTNRSDLSKLMRSKTQRARAIALKEVAASFDPKQDYQEALFRLHEFKHSLENGPLQTMAQREASAIWEATDEAIMFLMTLGYTGKAHNIGIHVSLTMATSKTSNEHTTAFNRMIQAANVDVRTEYVAYEGQLHKKVQALADHYGINTGISGGLFKISNKGMFKNLFTTDNTEKATAFILKSPDHKSLVAVERDFLLFFNSKLEEFAKLSSPFKIPSIHGGWMPLVRKSASSVRSDRGLMKIDILKKIKEKLGPKAVIIEDQDLEMIDEQFAVKSMYDDQVPVKGDLASQNFNRARHKKLGVDEFGTDLKGGDRVDLNKFDDNLKNVLDSFVMASLEAHHYKSVTAYGRAQFYKMRRQEDLTGETLGTVINTMTLIMKRVIKHETSEGKSAPIKFLNDFTHLATISFTITQGLLETFTNPFVTVASYWSDKLYGLMFKGNRDFSAKSYALASKYVWNDFGDEAAIIKAIDLQYGITNSDNVRLRETLNNLEKYGIFQLKHGMAVNELMLHQWQLVTMTAYMIEQGSFHAHSLDKDGILVYDEKKDKRFYDVNASAEDRFDKEKFYEATKEEASKRGDLTGVRGDKYEGRELKKAFTQFDRNYVKEMIVEIYGSMDEESKSLATWYTWAGMLTKMKTWITAKIPRYFQKPKTAQQNWSMSRLEKVMDDKAIGGYRYSWKGQATEGILYTIRSQWSQLLEFKSLYLQERTITEHQKKNFGKLMADISVAVFFQALALGAYAAYAGDDDDAGEFAKLMRDRAIMATGDVFLLYSLSEMITGNGSMMVAISVAGRALSTSTNFIGVGGNLMLGDKDTDIDDFKTASNNIGRTLGAYRSGEMIYDGWINE